MTNVIMLKQILNSKGSSRAAREDAFLDQRYTCIKLRGTVPLMIRKFRSFVCWEVAWLFGVMNFESDVSTVFPF
jgi:hypothetical protein